jgi:succinate dehydrogenase iron-sulfur subunit
MSKGEAQVITVKIFRFDPSVDSEPCHKSYEVPYDAQETILGVLQYISRHYDPSLAYRESCRIGNCKGCMVRVNGTGVVACRKTLKELGQDPVILDPISKDKIIRDLICEI